MNFYQEENGDYIVVYPENGYRETAWFVSWDARGAAIEKMPSSAQSCSVSDPYLRECKKVERCDVPKEWLQYLE